MEKNIKDNKLFNTISLEAVGGNLFRENAFQAAFVVLKSSSLSGTRSFCLNEIMIVVVNVMML